MDLPQAQAAFTQLLNEISDAATRGQFLDWLQETRFETDDAGGETKLRRIAETIRDKIPTSGLFPSEGPSKPLDNSCEVHVDAFLHDDEAVDELFRAGRLDKYCCGECGSRSVRPLTLVSHSMSIERISYIFQSLLPRLDAKVVLDVGSRLGTVLYGAYFYSAAKEIIGIEMNEQHVDLQREVIGSFHLGDRVQVLHGDILSFPFLFHVADVVVLHNVFENFLPPSAEKERWEFLRKNVRKPGTLVVAIPDLVTTMARLNLDERKILKPWVRKMDESLSSSSFGKDHPELTDVSLYVVN